VAQLVDALHYKVMDYFPHCVIGIYHRQNPSSCTMAVGLTQPLTEMSSGNISWGLMAAGA